MNNKCKNCAGQLVFSPEEKAVKCLHCGFTKDIPYILSFEKKEFEEISEVELDETNNLKRIKCKSCGAELLLGKREIQAKCPYCGDVSLSQSRKAKIKSVDSIIPFSFNKTKALKMFKAEIAGHVYTNKKLFKNVTEEDVQGMYINSFVFDFNTSTTYKGVFSYRKTYTDSNGDMQTKTVKVYASGTHNLILNDITIEANSKLNQYDFNYIHNYNYASAVKYNDDFLNGYMVEFQDTMFEDCVELAKKEAERKIDKALLERYNCDKIETLSKTVNYVNKKCNYSLLPVYFVNTIDPKTNEKIQVLMNGQTGKVGKTPKDMGKILLTVFLSLGFVIGFIILIMVFMFFVV